MDLSNLKPAKGSVKGKKRRLGRGQGSGRGGTSTKGHKGQQSRSGYSKQFGFEGGQMPLQRRIPKYGFTNINRKEFKGVNLDILQSIVDRKKVKEIDLQVLRDNGLVSKKDLVKILGRGELKSKLKVEAHAFSASAKKAIEDNGGETVILSQGKKKSEKVKVAKATKAGKDTEPTSKLEAEKKSPEKEKPAAKQAGEKLKDKKQEPKKSTG